MGKLAKSNFDNSSKSIRLSTSKSGGSGDDDEHDIIIDLVDLPKKEQTQYSKEYEKRIKDIEKSKDNYNDSLFDYAYSLRFKDKSQKKDIKTDKKSDEKEKDVHWIFKMIKKHSTIWFYAVGWSMLAIAAWLIARTFI